MLAEAHERSTGSTRADVPASSDPLAASTPTRANPASCTPAPTHEHREKK